MFVLYVYFLDINRWEQFRYASLLLALISWGGALFLSVKNSGPFDELSFHRTRPFGDRCAFLRHTKLLGWTLLLVFCAMLARGFWYHLGARTSLVGALTLTLLVAVFGAVFSTGFSLCLTGVHRKKLALALLLGLPLVCLILLIGDALPSWLGIRRYMLFSLHSGITCGLLMSCLCACIAWFLAASMRRWKTSLAFAVFAIFLLPMYLGNGSLLTASYSVAQLQTSPIKIRLRKNIDEADRKHSCSVAQFLRCEEPMQVGEFVTLRFEFPNDNQTAQRFLKELEHRSHADEFRNAQFSLTSDYGKSPTIHARTDVSYSVYTRPQTMVLENLFPHARFSLAHNFSLIRSFEFNPVHTNALYDSLTKGNWKCSGSRYLMRRTASFRLDTGGVYITEGGGLLKVNPLVRKNERLSAQVNTLRPLKHHENDRTYNHLIFFGILDDFGFVLTNADETKAIDMSKGNGMGDIQFGAEAFEIYPVIQIGQLKDWTAEDIRDAKIHVLQTKTLERIEFDQSHLILEE
jgi:hypothetical protein